MLARYREYLQERIFIFFQKRGKLVLIGFLILLTAFCVGGYLGFYRMPFSSISPFEAVPSSTSLIFETKEVQKTVNRLRAGAYFRDLSKVLLFEKWIENAHWIDSLCLESSSYSDFSRKAHWVCGAQMSAADDFEWLFVLKNRASTFATQEFIAETGLKLLKESSFRGARVYQVTDGKATFSISYYCGLVLISKISTVVEYGIVQLNNLSTRIIHQQHFRAVNHTAGSGDLSIYVNYSNLDAFWGMFMHSQRVHLLKSMALEAWSNLDARFHKEGFVMSGHTYPSKANRFWSNLAERKPAKEVKVHHIVSDQVAFLLHVAVEDYPSFSSTFTQSKWPDFERYVLPWLGDEVAYMIMNPSGIDSLNFSADKLLAIRTKDSEQAKQALMDYGERFGILDEQKQIDGSVIRRIVGNNWALPLLGEGCNDIHNPYYIVVDDFVVLSNTQSTLENWLASYNNNNVIANRESFASQIRQMQYKSNAYILLNTPYAFRLILSYFRPNFHNSIERCLDSIQKISPIGIQFVALQKHFLTTLSASWTSEWLAKKERHKNIAWTCNLKHEARTKPFIVRNHHTKAYEIFIQDEKNIIYLIDQSGNVIWDKALEEPILSTVYQIDFYGNGKLQYAFNTTEHVYIMDRKKNLLKKIPLVAPASAGMLVVNYGMGKRLFVPCQNGHIYGYTKNGKPLAGWNPQTKAPVIDLPIQFFRHQDKDYLLAANTSGAVHLFRRNGEFHVKPFNIGGKISSIELDEQLGRIVAAGTNGALYIANAKGKRFGIAAEKRMTQKGKFAYANVIGDKRKDYIRLSNKRLTLSYYNEKQKFEKAFEYVFDKPQDEVFTVRLKGAAYADIAVVSKQMQQLFLLNAEGKVKEGFPLVGTSRFELVDLFKEGKNSLVVANRDMLYVYKLY